MSETSKRMKWLKRMLIIAPIAILTLLVAVFIYVYIFNKTERVTEGCDSSEPVYAEIVARTDSTSSWLKRNFPLEDGTTTDLNAQIYDAVFYNNSQYKVQNWAMQINIKADCYLNKAWNGTMEIHQHVLSGEEKTQTLNLQNFDLDEITLDYTVFDGDLMIPLSAGDYIIYLPASGNYDEMPLAKGLSRTIGFILDFEENPDLTDYQVVYNYKRNITDGHAFIIILALAALWFVCLMMFIAAQIAYKRAAREAEIKKSGIMCMSDAYSIIYIIDLVKNTITPLVADEESERLRPKDIGADEQLTNMIEWDSTDSYLEVAENFVDLKSLPERLQDKNTIVCEYVSKTYGWCRIRFFAMDRVENQPIGKAIFTIRVINEEKKELEEISKRVDAAEEESKTKSVFLANMSHEIRTPINTVIGFDTMIMRETKEKSIAAYAKNIKSAANMLLSLINSILDFSKMEAGKMELVYTEYSLKQVLADVQTMVSPRFEAKNLILTFEVAENLPDKLYGDDMRLKQIMINLLTNAAKYTNEGSAKLSIYGKVQDEKAHLLVSVKDTGIGIRPEDMEHLTQRFARLEEERNHKIEGTGLGLNLVSGLLELMDSELKVVSEYGTGSEFYFEFDQKVMDPKPIGKLDFTKLDEEDEAYQVSFTAPDAKILVVDDNPLNLTVFENLLKDTNLQIDKANSGTEALTMTVGKQYDIIFMDHMMPAPDGVATFQMIRDQEPGVNIKTPVIMLTANALKGAEKEYRDMGFTDFLAKPIQPEVLEEMIMKYLDPSKYTKGKKTPAKDSAQTELPTIEGVDVTYGLAHAGGLDSLMKIIEQFVRTSKSDLEELNGYFAAIRENPEDGNSISSYRIKVHAMKASARVLGALKVSGVAEALEEAARNSNVQEILDVSPYFDGLWNGLTENLRAALPREEEAEDKAEADSETLHALLHQLEVAMRAFDFKTSDKLLVQLNEYAFKGDKKDQMEELKTAVANLDAEKVAALCEALMQE